MLRSFFITFLIAILFGKENTQNMFVVFFAKGVADKEENQRSADADNYLVQIKEFDLQRHSSAVGEYAASHSENGAGAVGFFPEQPEDQDPEECCFQASESEHIYFPDNAGWGNGNKVNSKAKDNGSTHAEQTYRIIGNCFMAFGAFVHIYLMIAEEEASSREDTVEIVAAIGPMMVMPAQKGSMVPMIVSGVMLSTLPP